MTTWTPFTSIRAKVFALVVALSVVLVTFLGAYFSGREIKVVRESMLERGDAYGRLLGKQVEPAIAFDDPEAAREIFASAAADRDIQGMVLYRGDGTSIAASSVAVARESRFEAVNEQHTVISDSAITVYAPVANKDGPRGVLILTLSTASIELERVHVRRIALAIGVCGLAVGLLAAWWIARSIAGRLARIAWATQLVAAGDLTGAALPDGDADEVGDLARGFNVMRDNLRSLLAEVRSKSQEERARSEELRARTEEMRLIFDHVAEGLFTVNADGIMTKERSRALSQWFDDAAPRTAFWDYLGDSAAHGAAWTRLCWETLTDGVMPFEVGLAQLPAELHARDRVLAVTYQPIFTGGEFSKMLVVVSDITARVARERADASQRELVMMFERILRDKPGFAEFYHEAQELISMVEGARVLTPELSRAIHTLKGNAPLFGLQSVSLLCHQLETEIVATSELPGESGRRALLDRWSVIVDQVSTVCGPMDRQRLDVEVSEYDHLLAGLLSRAPHGSLAHEVWLWRLERVSQRFARTREQARALAARLGKPDVEIVTEDNGLRVEAQSWGPFWASFVHVIRNALDHGIESREERERNGKSGPGRVKIRAFVADSELVVEVSDDGRGIEWEKLAAKGRALGHPCSTEQERIDLLFLDGVSVKDEASEISGRGLGLAAVRAACRALGGSVRVSSTARRGTTMQFRFPQAAMGDRFLSQGPPPLEERASLRPPMNRPSRRAVDRS